MAATGTLYIEDPDTALLTYTSIRVYRGTTNDPATAAFTALVTTIPLVSGTTQYSFTDSSADANTIWRSWFYHTGTTANSALGAIFRPSSFTLRSLRYEAARMAHAASAGLCSSVGTTTTLIDAGLLNSGKDTFYHAGDYPYRPDAALAADRARRCLEEPFNITSGALSVPTGNPWTNAPASAEAYQLFQLFPPISMPGEALSWDDIIRQALRRLWVRDQVDLGIGTSTGKTRYSITAVAPFVHKLRIANVWFRTINATTGFASDMLFGKQGSYWLPVDNGADGIYLDLSQAPGITEHVIIDCQRTYPPLYADTDVVAGSDGAFDLAVAAVARQALITARQQGNPVFADVESQYRELQATYGARSGGVS